jgi:hypothetical protein
MTSWQSQKQKTFPLSTCEAKYMAASATACQGIWLVRLLGDLRNTTIEGVELKLDNQSCQCFLHRQE